MFKRIADFFIDPHNTVRIHLIFGLAWLIIGTPVTILWLANSVPFVAWMSLYAIVVSHWAGLQGSLADLRVKKNDDEGVNEASSGH